MTLADVSFDDYSRLLEKGDAMPHALANAVGEDASPYDVLRHLVPRDERRRRGTFFTSSDVAARLWEQAIPKLAAGAIVVDPACGGGDLLLPAFDSVLANDTAQVTFRACDVDASFSRVAAARLRQRDPKRSVWVESEAVDFLEDSSSVADATHVVLNPPFVSTEVPVAWASGNVNAAAVFVARAVESMRPGSRLLAVLPDVLRSGTRYSAWRDYIASLSAGVRVRIGEIFDDQTDVHVFLLDLEVGSNCAEVEWIPPSSGATLGDFANIRVGPVVPHRDPADGPLLPFVTARSLSSGESMERRYSGRREQGPFVLVNRTSRPGEVPRVRARPWRRTGAVAIENHLLIVEPREGVTCDELIAVLTSKKTTEFLEARIRCRHLTVGALKEIPWQE
ncbi:hypothetical protein QE416_002189 [Microbacterium sp. SORGH_AS 421]|nr:hypothetical protein [Microbacterium sp. SORGH_AS_0421]